MKKVSILLVVLMVSLMAMSAVAMADTVLGQALYAAHGTRAFCVATVAMDGDVITAVYLDEYQFVNPETFEGVPNAESFTNADGNVLASKRLNDAAYSASMEANGGATQTLAASYEAIEAFCVGKTIAELEAATDGVAAEDMLDVVTSSTLADTLGYLLSIIEAAKSI